MLIWTQTHEAVNHSVTRTQNDLSVNPPRHWSTSVRKLPVLRHFFKADKPKRAPSSVNIAIVSNKGLSVDPGKVISTNASGEGRCSLGQNSDLATAFPTSLEDSSFSKLAVSQNSAKNVKLLQPRAKDSQADARLSLILYGPEEPTVRGVSVKLHSDLDNGSPSLVLLLGSHPVAFIPTEEAHLQFDLAAGSIATVLHVLGFSGLRDAGGDGSEWISAPEATLVEFGENQEGVCNSDRPSRPRLSFNPTHPTPTWSIVILRMATSSAQRPSRWRATRSTQKTIPESSPRRTTGGSCE